MVESGKVEHKIENGIGTITFSHPRANSLPGALLRNIAATVEELGNNPTAKVIVLQSSGEKVFCSGASFDELQAVKNLEQSKHFFSGFATLILAMRRCPKLIIARVQGKATGGGVGVISAADYALATEGSAVKLSELALGFGPFIIGPAVERRVGRAAFSAMAIDADWRSAEWCKTRGLYVDVYPGITELDSALGALSKRLSNFNPEAMNKLKRILWEGTDHWEQLVPSRVEITSQLALTPFVQQAVAAAAQK